MMTRRASDGHPEQFWGPASLGSQQGGLRDTSGCPAQSHAWCQAVCPGVGRSTVGSQRGPQALAQLPDSGPEQDWILPADGSSIQGDTRDTGDSATCPSTHALAKLVAPLASLAGHHQHRIPLLIPSSLAWLLPAAPAAVPAQGLGPFCLLVACLWPARGLLSLAAGQALVVPAGVTAAPAPEKQAGLDAGAVCSPISGLGAKDSCVQPVSGCPIPTHCHGAVRGAPILGGEQGPAWWLVSGIIMLPPGTEGVTSVLVLQNWRCPSPPGLQLLHSPGKPCCVLMCSPKSSPSHGHQSPQKEPGTPRGTRLPATRLCCRAPQGSVREPRAD